MALSDEQRRKLMQKAAAAQAAQKNERGVLASGERVPVEERTIPKLINWKPFAIIGVLVLIAAGIGLYILSRNSNNSQVSSVSEEATAGDELSVDGFPVSSKPIIGQRGEIDETTVESSSNVAMIETDIPVSTDFEGYESTEPTVSDESTEPAVSGNTPHNANIQLRIPVWCLTEDKSTFDVNSFVRNNQLNSGTLDGNYVVCDVSDVVLDRLEDEQLVVLDGTLNAISDSNDFISRLKATSDRMTMDCYIGNANNEVTGILKQLLRASYLYELYKGLPVSQINPVVNFYVADTEQFIMSFSVRDFDEFYVEEPIQENTPPVDTTGEQPVEEDASSEDARVVDTSTETP